MLTMSPEAARLHAVEHRLCDLHGGAHVDVKDGGQVVEVDGAQRRRWHRPDVVDDAVDRAGVDLLEYTGSRLAVREVGLDHLAWEVAARVAGHADDGPARLCQVLGGGEPDAFGPAGDQRRAHAVLPQLLTPALLASGVPRSQGVRGRPPAHRILLTSPGDRCAHHRAETCSRQRRTSEPVRVWSRAVKKNG